MAQTQKFGTGAQIFTGPVGVFMQRTWGWGDTNPTKWPVDCFFLNRTLKTLYRNIGTLTSPTWEPLLSDASGDLGLIIALSD